MAFSYGFLYGYTADTRPDAGLFRAFPVIRIGSVGRHVKQLQEDLNGLALNYNGFPLNGVYEEKTKAAVRNFQDRFHLPSDGVVGPVTWKLINENVRAVQKLLNARKYAVGYPDGVYGPATAHSVQRFQSDHGLYPSDIIDPRTRRRLFNPSPKDDMENRPTSLDLNSLNPHVAAMARRLLELSRAHHLDVRITTAFRSWAEEDALFAQGRTTPGPIVTNARGGDSYHNWGLAFDAAPYENGVISKDDRKFIEMGHLGQQVGLEWGGTFKSIVDLPHFQYTFGLNTWDLLNGIQAPQ